MPQQLIPSEIKSYTEQAVKIYEDAGFSQEIIKKFIEIDISGMNLIFERIDKLEKNPTVDEVIEINKNLSADNEKEIQLCRDIGCTEEQIKQIQEPITKKLAETDLLKNIIMRLNKAILRPFIEMQINEPEEEKQKNGESTPAEPIDKHTAVLQKFQELRDANIKLIKTLQETAEKAGDVIKNLRKNSLFKNKKTPSPESTSSLVRSSSFPI